MPPIRRTAARGLLVLAGSIGALGLKPAAAQTTINFDDWPSGTGYIVGTPVPESYRLSDQYLSTFGVGFRSQDASYVGVVNLGVGHATSGSIGIGAVGSANTLTYVGPIIASFFDRTNPMVKAFTNAVSIRADRSPAYSPITLTAFDVNGYVLTTDTEIDAGGTLLTVSASGIHRVEILGNGTTAFDDLSFNELNSTSTVPEPLSMALLGTGLAGLGAVRRRRRKQQEDATA